MVGSVKRTFRISGWQLCSFACILMTLGCTPRLSEKTIDEASALTFAERLERIENESGSTSSNLGNGAIAAEESLNLQIKGFCGDCHALPRPNSFEQDVWYEEIRQGYEFYARSGRSDLTPPPLEEVLRFYRRNAPARMDFPVSSEVDPRWLSRFTTTKLDWKDGNYITPAVSSIAWVELMEPGRQHLIVCDMRDGSVSLVDPNPASATRSVLARLQSPARVALADFDADGHKDLVVADLGSFKPFDHQLGQVVLLHRQADSSGFEPTVLASGLGRVADCTVGNFRGDEQLDLLVAEFGHRRAGSIRLLTNRTKSGQAHSADAASSANKFQFEARILDIRPGAIQLPMHDWNADGKSDFAAVISQEYEAVDLFINRDTRFEAHNIFLGDDLSFGSVGMELVDLDQDGDQDILHVHGDCFDNNYANLSHGVSWHENLGNLRFRTHRLADLPGAYRALSRDLDNDGDQDVLVVANLPTAVKPLSLRESNPVAILLLEQQGDSQAESLQFVPHVLERGTARYPALEIADFDFNGKLDFAVGAQLFDTDPADSPAAELPRLTIWWQK